MDSANRLPRLITGLGRKNHTDLDYSTDFLQ